MIRLTELNFENQVKKMVGFIEQEGKERAEEILSRAEEDYNLQVGRLLQSSRIQIMRLYEQREKQVAKSKIIQMSSMYSEARGRILRVRYEHVRKIIQEVKKKLILQTDTPFYHKMLHKLILQGLLKMGVKCDVMVSVAKKDEEIVKNMLGKVVKEHNYLTGANCTLTIGDNYLPEKEIGGVELITYDCRIMVRNTLRSRLIQVTERMIPLIRYGLYGFNPHRKAIS